MLPAIAAERGRRPPKSEDAGPSSDTTPDAIEAALRELLRERHAANRALVPARVLNLIVVADREWRGEVVDRLERRRSLPPLAHDPLHDRGRPRGRSTATRR